ncbi:MAG: hypothetical protein OEY45_05585 [Gammaproteobacteria bacterium]|nr:hypothetical protein [Gammaproteobacteria bacterium]
MRHRILTLIAITVLFISPYQTANALGPGDALVFADGAITCEIGGTPPNNCDLGLTRVIGSYFAIDFNGNGTVEEIEKTPVSANEGITIGFTQPAFGSHSGCIFGTETPSIDLPWCFFGNTGMFQTTGTPVTVAQDNGASKMLDFAGFGVTWNGIPNIPLGGEPGNFPADTGLATLSCNPSDCSDLTNFTLDYSAHVPIGDPSGFGGVHFFYHLERPANVPLSFSISVAGGDTQECSTAGGSVVAVSSETVLPDGDSIASITWTVNGVVAGLGETLNADLVLGSNTITADLLTTMGQTASDTANVLIRDTTSPVITADFFDEQTGESVSQITHSDRIVIRYSADDVCDVDPLINAMMGTSVDDGHVFNVTTSGKLIAKEVESLDLTVKAMDASGNKSMQDMTLIVTQ